VNLYFAGGYQNNSGIDIFHEKEPTSIDLISTLRICKRLLEDRGLHEEGHHEAPLGRPASTLGRPVPDRRPSAPSFASYFNRLQGYILTLCEGRFDLRATISCSGLYKRGPRPPFKGEFIQSIINQKAEDQPATIISLELHQI
jgi:hypothetical protein